MSDEFEQLFGRLFGGQNGPFQPSGDGRGQRGGRAGGGRGAKGPQGPGGMGFPPFSGRGRTPGGRGGGGDEDAAAPARRGRPGPLVLTLLVLIVLGLLIGAASHLWTEVLWFTQLGYARVLWTEWIAYVGLFLFGFVVAAALLYVTLRLAARPAARPPRAAGFGLQNAEALARAGKKITLVLPLLVGLFAGSWLAPSWRDVLVAVYGKSFGKVDQTFGIDLSFFMFRLPLLDLLLTFLVLIAVAAGVLTVVAYYLRGAVRFVPRLRVYRRARVHLGILAAVICVLLGLRYFLDRYVMVFDQGAPTDGAMYTAVHAMMPAKLILAVIAIAIAVLFLVAAFRGAWYLPVAGIGVMIVSALVLGAGYPFVVQRFKVNPNEMALESPYIQRNIDATLAAYGMADMEYKNYTAKTKAAAGQLREDSASTSQIRLLDPEIIAPTVRQMQQSRPYYTFPDEFAVDRYRLKDAHGKEEKRDTVIAVRDINLKGLSASQRNWVNDHTVYTHGFGVVAAYGNHLNTDGLPDYWEQSIPSVGEIGKYEPRVYFSTNSPDYSVVGAPKGAAPQELDYPDDMKKSGQVRSTFVGNGGPSIGNPFYKLLYAIKFRSPDLFFSDQLNSHSQILYDRSPALRVSKVAPYLTLDNKPYPAVVDMDGDPATPKRLVWIIDGYTTSDSYPYSQHVNLDEATADSRTKNPEMFAADTQVNYMRNSVKAVVDAYNGSVSLYEWDKKDPVLKTWESIYPGQVKPMSQISGDLMSHLRYPEDLFKVQRSLLANYHVKSAPQFYTGGDQWRLSEDPTQAGGVTRNQRLQPPYYLTMKMPSQETAEFSLTSVFVPGGTSRRAAMAGFLAVDSETGNQKGKVRPGYGKLRMIALPSSTTVPGPGQVQNNFNSNTTVNRELNLQDQQGSKVLRGNLLTLPVGGGLLYVQPVYIQSTGDTSYPQLRNVLVAFGDSIGFAPTLEKALDQVFEGNSAAQTAASGAAKEPAGKGGKGGKGQPGAKGQPAPAPTQAAADAKAKLTQALTDAQKAIHDADKARQAGDWAAYGKAQQALGDAVTRAQQAKDLLDK